MTEQELPERHLQQIETCKLYQGGQNCCTCVYISECDLWRKAAPDSPNQGTYIPGADIQEPEH